VVAPGPSVNATILRVGAALFFVGAAAGWWLGRTREWRNGISRMLVGMALLPWLAYSIWLRGALAHPVANSQVPDVSILAEAWPAFLLVLVVGGLALSRPYPLRWALPAVPLLACVVTLQWTGPALARATDHPALHETAPLVWLVWLTTFGAAAILGYVFTAKDPTLVMRPGRTVG
jgi:hypothetical protein